VSDRPDQAGDRLVDVTRKREQPVAIQHREAVDRREHDAIPVHSDQGIQAVRLEDKIQWTHGRGDSVANIV
jgi:hypothetical protein